MSSCYRPCAGVRYCNRVSEMAPILTTATGFEPQVLDDPSLQELLDKLKALSLDNIEETLPKLVALVTPWTQAGIFEEQVRQNVIDCSVIRVNLALKLIHYLCFSAGRSSSVDTSPECIGCVFPLDLAKTLQISSLGSSHP